MLDYIFFGMWTTFVDYFENQIAAFNQLIEE
jgi:hypothetical protein